MAATDQTMTVPALLAHNRTTCPDRDAIVTHGHSVTHGELDRASRRVAESLVADGVRRGMRVALLAENGVDWVVVAVAVMRMGAVLVPLSTLLRVPELTAQLDVAAIDVVVSTGRFRCRDLYAEVAAASADVRSVRSIRHLADLVADNDQLPTPHTASILSTMEESIEPSDDLVVLFTSGSRGAPKGVVHTHGGAVRAVTAGLDARRIGGDDRLYAPMPLFWTGGFSVGLFTMLVAGCTFLTEAEPEPLSTLALLERERATLFRGWPAQAARLAEHPECHRFDLSALRQASLPELLPPERRPPPGSRPSVLGMTETFGPYCADPLDIDLPPELRGCSGRPFPGIEVRIVDPERGYDRAVGEEGEIWLRGPSLLRGICGRDHDEVFTPDGWFRTGDLAQVDGAGRLRFAGRLDDMFKVSGATVYPVEVEAALAALPDVVEAHVVDVPHGGSTEVGALVVSSRSGDELRAGVRERLSAFKVPTRWIVSDNPADVPRSPTGKVDSARLRSLLAASGLRPTGGKRYCADT